MKEDTPKSKRLPSPSNKVLYPLIILLFAVVTLINQHSSLGRMVTPSGYDGNSYASSVAPPRRPKLGDGCYHVFLDVGSNIGIHARFLYEPHLYPDSKTSVPAFAREFGFPRDNRDYCVFSFEPNPKFEKRHSELAEAYRAVGWRYVPIIAGAGSEDGNLTFYHSAFEKEEWETGFSAVTPKTLYGGNGTSRTVDIVRLATWITDEIQDRIIPTKTHSDVFSEPTVIMKLDIEGLEFKVFPDLVTTGALCNNIHFLMGEFHYDSGNWNYYPITLTKDERHVLKDRKQGERLARQMLHFVDVSDNCMTNISLDDDESYLTDPHDYPKPNETAVPS
mmetsp:Transcript_24381/g.52693  ORF Transcript_24381/g.52693 Transcript_24381/m.52693 type:complete len:334 (+) Transcript_24381:150-1151(+)